MASKRKQQGMVLHQERVATLAAAPAADHPFPSFVVPKPGKASEGVMEQSPRVTKKEADVMGRPTMYPSKEPIRTTDGLPSLKHPAGSNPQSDNLSPDRICKGIKVTLDNNSMWNEFFKCNTEMILTKQGSRMFPYCRFRISGLQPSRKYSLFMDIHPLDDSRYKWTDKSWQVAGKAECHVKSQAFTHPESPSTGQHWMQNPVSFYKLKLTNSIMETEGNTVLHPMHRYLPRLHLLQTDQAAKDIKLNGPSVVTFTFPQTEFMAVTAYQNSRLSQLKVDYNPFAKGLKEEGASSCGLKLKSNSGKNLRKDGDTTTNEQRPVKTSLKSLLAHHKPRSLKTVDTKPSGSGDLQKNSTTNEDQATASDVGESPCSVSRPAQKLFSELIREAHVSLHRCNLEQLSVNTSTSPRTEQTITKTTTLKSTREDVPKRDGTSVKTQSNISSAKNGGTVVPKRKVREDNDILNTLNCKDHVKTDCSGVNNVVATPAVPQNSSVDSDHQYKAEAPSGGKLKQHKRPLPLPALALFLKQHSTKSKKAKSKLDSPPVAVPSTSLSDSQGFAPACPPSDQRPLRDLSGETTKSINQSSGHTGPQLHPDEIVFNVTGQALETAPSSSPSSPHDFASTDAKVLRTDGFLASASAAERSGPESVVPDETPVLLNYNQSFCTLGTLMPTVAPTPATSPILSSPLDTVLPALNSPQTPTITESSALPLDSPTMKSDALLPDPEGSLFGFDPLSPASSPEPLPSLPISLALELDCTTSESTPKAVSPEEFPCTEDSTTSVFKWHTVLPLPEPFIDTSFTTFQPTPQTLPLVSVTSPLLPSQTPSRPELQTLDTSTSMPSLDPDPSFQENEQPLPFPTELSPLALQMPLSPTFSSLDGDGLSPTPSIADLVQFFSINDDLGMGVEFPNTEAVTIPCLPPSTVEANALKPSQQEKPIPANKPYKHKKKSRQRRLVDADQNVDASTYTRMQPNLEEVEEQLFISFTSKEALKLHVADSDGPVPPPQTTPEGHLQQADDAPENEPGYGSEEAIVTFERVLLRDLKLMRHGQVIHPVLQEVGLKMNLLDPTLVIDLQYLGVRLPIPPPGVSLDDLLPLPQAFVSRTGKTSDVTQIKGWREKFTPSEAPPTLTPATPEAGPSSAGSSSDLPKKNLSAFCSDMLDEYLETEGKLIDERAASFSQPLVEPVVYELPTRSTSYVRTLDSILKKQTTSSPTSDLISGFIPPSKRPKVPKVTLKETRSSRRPKGPKNNKTRAEPAPGSKLALSASPAESNLVTKQPAVQIPAAPPEAEHTEAGDEAQKFQFHQTANFNLSTQPKRKKKFKPKTSSQTLSPPKPTQTLSSVSEEMAPLESDSELGTAVDQSGETHKKVGEPVMTRALLRQKDLEEGVVWEGRPRTSITEERAAIALTSLFTLKGFVRENPTTPIQLVPRRAPPCLNEFCRLGCVCSSLAYCSRISHCGRLSCMLGCSCLKQKVVLLKNLDGSDSSPSRHGHNKRRKRRKRMKMAYVLKEADSVSQPAERVRTLWKRADGDSDPDPINVPGPSPPTQPTIRPERRELNSSCARVRGYLGRTKRSRKRTRKELTETCIPVTKTPDIHLSEQSDLRTRSCSPPAGDPDWSPPSARPPNRPTERKPSKRLTIVADCKWEKAGDRSLVLKMLCEAMAQEWLDKPFWIQDYLISPVSQMVEGSTANRCIHYKMHISRPKLELEKPRRQRGAEPQQEPVSDHEHLKQVVVEAEPLEDWQREVEEEEVEPLEDWQQEVEEEVQEEAEPLEDWQQEVEEELEEEVQEKAKPLEDWQQEVDEGDIEEEAEPTNHQVHDSRESSRQERLSKKMMVSMALPFLTGVSAAGFLSAKRKLPGGTDHLVEVNGKLYPLAKIQLGKMGALHPANRLAAYLTGRVGSNRKQGSSSSKPPQSSGPTVSAVSTPPPRSQLLVPVLNLPTSPKVSQPAVGRPDKSAASSDHPTGEISKGAGTRFVTVKAYPGLKGGVSQVRVVPAASTGTTASSDPQLSSSVAPRGSQVLMIQVPPPPGKLPVPVQTSCLPPPTSSSGRRMVLQPVPTVSGIQYYRRPDGKLVQLVPISQLGSVNQNLCVKRALPPTSLQTNQTPTVTKVTSLSGLKSSSPSPLASPACLNSGLLSQKGMCTFKILPPKSSRDPIHITFPKLPSKAAVASPVSSPSLAPPPPVLPSTSLQNNQTPPPTKVISVISPSSLSALKSSSPSPLASPVHLNSGLLSQKGMCTFKILPPKSSRDPILITCPKPSPQPASPSCFTHLQTFPPTAPPMTLISLKPSTGRGAEIGVKTVTVSPTPVSPTPVSPTPVSPVPVSLMIHQTPAIQTSAGTRPPDSYEVLPVPSPEPACNLVDLDIICVDDETASETGGGANQSCDMGELQRSCSDTDLSDLDSGEEEAERSLDNHRHVHNALEKQRRGKMLRLFEGLRQELGLSGPRESKISTLKKAVHVIQELRMAEAHLRKKKRRLTKRKEEFLSIMAPAAEGSQVTSRLGRPADPSEGRGTGSEDGGVVEVVDLLDTTSELTEISSGEEERPVTMATKVITVTHDEDVAVATVEEASGLKGAHRRLQRILSNAEAESSRSVTKLLGVGRQAASFLALRSVMNFPSCSKARLLQQAHQEIQTLQRETARLRSLKTCLNRQREILTRLVSQRSGKRKHAIQKELQQLLFTQREMENTEHPTSNQLPAAAEGAGSDPPAGASTDDDIIIITSSGLQRETSQAPLTTLASAPVQTPVQQPQSVLQVMKPVLAPPGVSHNASVARDRPKTVPNILSRSKNLSASQSLRALVPADVLTLVGAAFPGKQVLTMSPLMAAPSPAMASVTLNIPNLTNQQIHLTSLPLPPIGKMDSSSAPLTFTSLTGADFNNLLQLVQPSSTPQQILQPPQQILQPPQQILQPPQQILQPPQQILQPPQQIPQPLQQIPQPPQQIPKQILQPPQQIPQPSQQIPQPPQQIPQPPQQIPKQILQPPQQIPQPPQQIPQPPQQIPQPPQQIPKQTLQPPQQIPKQTLQPPQQIPKQILQPPQQIPQPPQQIPQPPQQIPQPPQQIPQPPQQIPQPPQQIPQPILQPPQQIPQPIPQPPQQILQPPQQIPKQILQPPQQIPKQILQPPQQIPKQILQPPQQIPKQILQQPQQIQPPQQILQSQQILQHPQHILQQPQKIQILQQPQQILQPAPQQQRLPASPPLRVPADSDQIKDQDQPESSSPSPPSTQGGPLSSLCPGPSPDQVKVVGPLGTEQNRETGDDEGLTSLLNEIVFLNQQTVDSATTAAGVPSPDRLSSDDAEPGHVHSPWVLELDSDSDDQTETTWSGPQPGPAKGDTSVLAPPPLLQMKAGMATVTDPASSEGAAGGEGGGGRRDSGGGGRRDGGGRDGGERRGGGGRRGGVAWRPMPRLVPLGLRGNPPS